MSKNRIFVGPGNIAGFAMYVANSLRFVGLSAKSYSYIEHPFGYPCDHDNILIKNPFENTKTKSFLKKIVINRYTLNTIHSIQRLFLFTYAIIRYDTFIFISHETFFRKNKDLIFLKYLKKKIGFIFVGCPEREAKDILNMTDGGFCSFCKDYTMQNSLYCFDAERKGTKIKFISKYSDIIFSHRDTTSYIVDKSKIRPFYCITYSNITLREINAKYQNIEQIIVTHLPSNKLLKGTDYVELSIIELKKLNYKIQYLSDRINHSEVEKILKKTHILVDQFAIGNGLLGVEAMANGCVVICRTAKWFREDFPELPLVSCEPEDLTKTLIDLLDNPEKMLNIALKSFEYYKKFHTPEVVGNYYKKTLNLS